MNSVLRMSGDRSENENAMEWNGLHSDDNPAKRLLTCGVAGASDPALRMISLPPESCHAV
jgi:hypothetical protein